MLKWMKRKAGETAQWLGALGALPEDPGLILASTWQLTPEDMKVRWGYAVRECPGREGDEKGKSMVDMIKIHCTQAKTVKE